LVRNRFIFAQTAVQQSLGIAAKQVIRAQQQHETLQRGGIVEATEIE